MNGVEHLCFTVKILAVCITVFLIAHFDWHFLVAYFILANATYHEVDSKSNVKSQPFMHESVAWQKKNPKNWYHNTPFFLAHHHYSPASLFCSAYNICDVYKWCRCPQLYPMPTHKFIFSSQYAPWVIVWTKRYFLLKVFRSLPTVSQLQCDCFWINIPTEQQNTSPALFVFLIYAHVGRRLYSCAYQ